MPPSISPIRRPLVEIRLESVEDAQITAATGVDRIELCSALALGGLTPSMGAIAAVRGATSLPIMVMIRPRPGGFAYAAQELAVMLRDIDFAIEAGADGIVFRMLTADGQIDMPGSTQIVRRIDQGVTV